MRDFPNYFTQKHNGCKPLEIDVFFRLEEWPQSFYQFGPWRFFSVNVVRGQIKPIPESWRVRSIVQVPLPWSGMNLSGVGLILSFREKASLIKHATHRALYFIAILNLRSINVMETIDLARSSIGKTHNQAASDKKGLGCYREILGYRHRQGINQLIRCSSLRTKPSQSG